MSITLVIIFLFFIFVFSGLEITYLSSKRMLLGAKNTIFASNHEQFFSTLLVGHTIFLVFYGIAFMDLIQPMLEPLIENYLYVLLIAIIFSTLIVLITAELVAKIIFRTGSPFSTRFLQYFGSIFYIVLYPLVKIIVFLAQIVLYPLGIRMNKEKKVFAKKDLLHFSDEISKALSSDEYEKDIQIFQNALDFPEVLIRECMLPFHQVRSIEINSSLDDLQTLFIESGFSRIIVYEQSKDKVVGYVSSKDFFKNFADITSMLRPIDFVPESMPAQKLLADFIKRKQALAVVVDEFGDITGLVSLEDIMEEIFGEIEDEHDSNVSIEKKISQQEYVLAGSLEVDYLNKKFELGIPECDDYQTLAGYIIFKYQSLPKKKAVLTIDNLKFTILKTSATRIELVKVEFLST